MKTLSILIITFILSCSESNDKMSYLQTENMSGTVVAEIINDKSENNTMLTDVVHYLKITNLQDSISYLVDYDLLEEFGGYESAIISLRWISDDELFIERYLSDRKQNLIYNLIEV